MTVIKITVHWDTGDEEYYFDDEHEAQMLCADALSKCGPVAYSWSEVASKSDMGD